MKKLIITIFTLAPTFIFAQVTMDSIVIFDYYKKGQGLYPQSGKEAINVTINKLNTFRLQATKQKRALFGNNTRDIYAHVPRGVYLQGIKIYYPKDTIFEIHVTGYDKRKAKLFYLDTLLQINSRVKNHLYFWAMLYEKDYMSLGFKPYKFILTPVEFSNKPKHNKIMFKQLEKFIRYTYNLNTKVFTH